MDGVRYWAYREGMVFGIYELLGFIYVKFAWVDEEQIIQSLDIDPYSQRSWVILQDSQERTFLCTLERLDVWKIRREVDVTNVPLVCSQVIVCGTTYHPSPFDYRAIIISSIRPGDEHYSVSRRVGTAPVEFERIR